MFTRPGLLASLGGLVVLVVLLAYVLLTNREYPRVSGELLVSRLSFVIAQETWLPPSDLLVGEVQVCPLTPLTCTLETLAYGPADAPARFEGALRLRAMGRDTLALGAARFPAGTALTLVWQPETRAYILAVRGGHPRFDLTGGGGVLVEPLGGAPVPIPAGSADGTGTDVTVTSGVDDGEFNLLLTLIEDSTRALDGPIRLRDLGVPPSPGSTDPEAAASDAVPLVLAGHLRVGGDDGERRRVQRGQAVEFDWDEVQMVGMTLGVRGISVAFEGRAQRLDRLSGDESESLLPSPPVYVLTHPLFVSVVGVIGVVFTLFTALSPIWRSIRRSIRRKRALR